MNLLVALMVVLATTYVCGSLASRFGQARVIGEMLGGILLGPTLLGRAAPTAWHAVFSTSTLTAFDALSTVGLVLYLFLIGSELDLSHMRRQGRPAAMATFASLALPLLAAMAIAGPAYRAFGGTRNSVAFVLFFSIALSITAFPVLARILEERGLTDSPLGVTALLCAAADDVCAWMLLAFAMSFVPRGAASIAVLLRVLLFTAYLLAMAGVAWLGRRWTAVPREQSLSVQAMSAVVLLVLASAAATDALGLHPLFGAFVAGLCFPRVPAWQSALRQRLEVPVTAVLLPVFFALTGLRMHLDLLAGKGVLPWLAIISLLAVAGKVGGGVLAARASGETWRNALALGAMLNTRGLVELIVLNIALTEGVFTPALFAVLVMMALGTTMMTAPALNLLGVGARASMR